jgi:polyhydroxybutyrate depolymerase
MRFLLAAAAACWSSVVAAQRTESGRLTWERVERTFTVRIPNDTARAMPLVILLHGLGGNGQTVIQRTGFDAKADAERFLLAAPDGTGEPRGWYTGFAASRPLDDVGFIGALMDTILARYPVDRRRIYVVGYSNGGVLAHRVASDLSKRIAATAVVAAAIGARSADGHVAHIDPPRAPVPILIMHGDADDVVPYGTTTRAPQGAGPVPAPDGAIFWARANECAVLTPRRDTLASGRVLRDVWDTRCRAPVIFLTARGGDHRWPRTGRGAAIEGSDVIWEFLRGHRR